MRRKHLFVLLVIVLLFTMLISGVQAADDTIRIGILIPLSGGSATAGKTLKWVGDWIEDYINNTLGGIKNFGGKKIELVYFDTQTDTTAAVSELERMMSDSSLFPIIIGGHNSNVGQAMSQYLIANDQLCIMEGVYANASFTTENDCIFHVAGCSATGSDIAPVRMQWARDNMPGYDGTIYGYLYNANDYGREAYEAQVAGMEANGVSKIVGVAIESGATDMSAEILKLKAETDVQYLTCGLTMSDAIVFLRQCKEYDVTYPIFASGSGFLVGDFLDQVGDAGDYVYTTGTWMPDCARIMWNPDWAWEISNKMKAELGWYPDEAASYMWESLRTLWDVMERTPSDKQEDLRKTLQETNISGEHMALLLSLHDSISFETYTSAATGVTVYNQNPSQYIPWAMAKDGMYHVFWPEKFADPEYPWVYPPALPWVPVWVPVWVPE